MRLSIRRSHAPSHYPPATELVEVVTPRTNRAIITPAENLFAALSPAEPVSFEIAATSTARWFLARAGTPTMRSHLEEQLGVAYPQASLRRLDTGRIPGLDPARAAPGEQVAACTLTLRAANYLPLRTFADPEVAADRASQADPVLGLLGALGNLPDGWRALSQLVLRPVRDDWCHGYLRLAVEDPLAHERTAARSGQADTSLTSVFLLLGLLTAAAVGLRARAWYLQHDWLHLGMLGGGLLAAGCLALLARRLGLFSSRPPHDRRLVQEKISRPAFLAQVRLAIFAPADAPRAAVEDRLRQLIAAYQQYDLAAGNGLVARRLTCRPVPGEAGPLTRPELLPPVRSVPVLNTRELAGLWHLPQAGADVPLVERTAARERLPLPSTVSTGCRIGESTHQGRAVPVSLPDELLRRHMLLVGKTRKGKSSVLSHVARHLMGAPPVGERYPALVLVDPHRDLARAVLGMVPPPRRDDVVFLDVGEEDRPFGLNLLDTGLGWSKSKAVANALVVFKREFDEYWGPRMEDCFRFALLTLFEANQAMCAADPAGRDRQHTVLEVPALLADGGFRRTVLKLVKDPVVRTWWRTYYEPLDRRLQLEIINPVQTKVQRYAGSEIARNIVGQPCSTIDPAAWVRDGAIVIVDTAKSAVGEDTAALIGGSLINLVALVVAEQGKLPEAERRRVTVLADEIQTMPGADYEAFLSELAKYGGNIVLSTQGLARLDQLDRDQARSLRATVFSNTDGLFAFQVSAYDAEYLAQELGGGLEDQDLLELGDYQCYARLSIRGERLPAFSVHLDPPPASDPCVAEELADRSAHRYGREREAAEAGLRAALERVEQAGVSAWRTGVADGAGPADGAGTPDRPPRNYHRPPKKRRAADQPPLPLSGSAGDHPQSAAEGTATDAGVPRPPSITDGGATDRRPGQSRPTGSAA